MNENYLLSDFTYKYHRNYGSPVINQKELEVRKVILSEDGLKARIVVDSLREGYIYEIKIKDFTASNGQSLLHDMAYYTLNQIPEGEKIAIAEEKNAISNHHHKRDNVVVEPNKERTAKTGSSSKRMIVMPKDWTNGPDQIIVIGTKPGLKYDLTEIQVKAGAKVKLVFNNNDMQHNLVIVKLGKALETGNEALKLGLKGLEKHYVPDSDDVLFHTNLLQPTSAETIYFVAPSTPADYRYVCTYPGHAYVMKGTMKVVEE